MLPSTTFWSVCRTFFDGRILDQPRQDEILATLDAFAKEDGHAGDTFRNKAMQIINEHAFSWFTVNGASAVHLPFWNTFSLLHAVSH